MEGAELDSVPLALVKGKVDGGDIVDWGALSEQPHGEEGRVGGEHEHAGRREGDLYGIMERQGKFNIYYGFRVSAATKYKVWTAMSCHAPVDALPRSILCTVICPKSP